MNTTVLTTHWSTVLTTHWSNAKTKLHMHILRLNKTTENFVERDQDRFMCTLFCFINVGMQTPSDMKKCRPQGVEKCHAVLRFSSSLSIVTTMKTMNTMFKDVDAAGARTNAMPQFRLHVPCHRQKKTMSHVNNRLQVDNVCIKRALEKKCRLACSRYGGTLPSKRTYVTTGPITYCLTTACENYGRWAGTFYF